MTFVLPFEKEISALDNEIAALPEGNPQRVELEKQLSKLESELYGQLSANDTFLLSGHPLRPKALDYIKHTFQEIRLFYNPNIPGDQMLVAGEAKLKIDKSLVDVMIIGQQTGPSSKLEDLLRLPVAEYKRWNQGMGFPDSYRKAMHFMDLAEQRGWPVIVFVDTPGADPSEYSEDEGQAFAINEVIHRTTALKTPNLSYILSLGASGGAIAITPTNRTIMNQYASYMVISPGGCASILFRNRSPESIRKAAEGLRLTSADGIRQGTVDEVVQEGNHPGHRYPEELLDRAKRAIRRNIAQMLEIKGDEAARTRREKYYAMGKWGESDETREPDAFAIRASRQAHSHDAIKKAIANYMAIQNSDDEAEDGAANRDIGEALERIGSRLNVARLIYAIEKRDATMLERVFGLEDFTLSRAQWSQLREYALARRYSGAEASPSMHPNGGERKYRRLHPVDWIRELTDDRTFLEFEETIRYCSVDQLGFPGYAEALKRGIGKTGLASGLVTGAAKIGGHETVLAINNFGLVGSSLCDEIGEKFRYAATQSLKTKMPLITVSMGGGARMQEGTPSMHRNIPKVHLALNELEEAGIPHISIICDPTLGGTAISYALRGDYMIVVAQSANIGFSGKRVVEQFQERKVPDDFQNALWLLRHGFVDERVATEAMAGRLVELLDYIASGKKLAELQTRRTRSWKPAQEMKLNWPRTRRSASKKKKKTTTKRKSSGPKAIEA